MKLGATITSERGKPVTKTGNEFIDVVVYNEDQKPTHAIHIIMYKTGRVSVSIDTDMRYGNTNVTTPGFIEESNGNLKHGTCKHGIDTDLVCKDCIPF